MNVQIQKLKWFGFRKYDSNRSYKPYQIPEFLSPKLAISERNDCQEYYCKLCGYGFPYASLHAIRMHALEAHTNEGGFKIG